MLVACSKLQKEMHFPYRERDALSMLEVTVFSFKKGTQCGPYNTTWVNNRVMYEKLAYKVYIYGMGL